MPKSLKFTDLCRQCAAEGIVLLKNDENTLPLKRNNRVSVFGRIQTNYIKSGTGSGGLVNAEYSVTLRIDYPTEDISINGFEIF